MKRNEFLATLAAAIPGAAIASVPGAGAVSSLSKTLKKEAGQVKITDVKFMRVKMTERGHVMPLVKIETDAGMYGIGECHHDVTGLGAKDVVMNAFRDLLIGQDPFDIERLTHAMKFRVSYLGGGGGIGMRYTKIDENKAKSLVVTATDPARGGVMSSNDDNVVLRANSIQLNPSTGFINGSVRNNWFVGKPFVDFLKNNNDPRLQHIAALYPDPSAANPGTPNTNPASQIGVPYGYTDVNIVTAPNYPGQIGSSFKYSQFNRSTVGRIDGWLFYVTYAQTQLLLAEARQRNYITTGTAKDFYEAGIKGHMTQRDFWTRTSGGDSPITPAEQAAYVQQPEIVFNPSSALKQINEQYWVASLMIWAEAYANFRRSGYPRLSPLKFPGEDPSVSAGDGFIHRLPYPLKEWSVNRANVQVAADRIGGDNMGTRIFWDK